MGVRKLVIFALIFVPERLNFEGVFSALIYSTIGAGTVTFIDKKL